MSIYNQNVRSVPTAGNPTGLYSDILNAGTTLSGSGAPAASIGIIGNSYIDTGTGIEYVKQPDNTWLAIYDPSTVPVNDPFVAGTIECNLLKTDELENDTFRGRLAESMVVDLGVSGVLSVTGNVDLVSNDLLNGGVINATEVDTPLVSASASKLLLTSFTGAGEGVQIGKNTDMLGNDLSEVGALTGTDGSFVVSSGTGVGSKLVLQAAGGATGGVDINPIGGGIRLKDDTDCETNNLDNIGIATATEYVMTNGAQTVNVLVDGPGGPTVKSTANLSLSGGVGFSVVSKTDLSLNNNAITNLAAINGSDLLTTARNLGVDQAGSLEFRELPQTYGFLQAGFGSVGTDYLTFGDALVGPGEFWCCPIGPTSKKLRSVSSRLIYNAPFSFNGGTAVIEVGTLANNVPATVGNFVVLYTLNLNTGVDYYESSVQGLDNLIASGSSIAVRSVLTGTSSSAVNAELVVNVVVQ